MNEKDLNGKKTAKIIKDEIAGQIKDFKNKFQTPPKLAIISVGDDPSAAAYIRSKQKTCEKLGMQTELYQYRESISFVEFKEEVQRINSDESIHGIILELPIPAHIPYAEAVLLIDPAKDVDGLHPFNLGLLFFGRPVFVPNTPRAVMKILEDYQIPLAGANVTVVGRSLAVGKPLGVLLMAENATVTTCHSRTKNLGEITSKADILVVSVGKDRLVGADMVREGAVVVDVGINVTNDGITGDVDYESVLPKVSRITPVPGGVGPLTVCMIIENTLKAARLNTGQVELRNKIYGLP